MGPEGARDRIALALADILAVKLPLLRRAHGYDDAELPEVDTITSGEKPQQHLNAAGDTWLEIVISRMTSSQVIDITPAGDQQFRIVYATRAYIWALGLSWTDAIDRRDRVTGAVRSCLWEFPTLTLAGGDTGFLVQTSGWTEEYGVPVRPSNPSGRCWATGMLAFDTVVEDDLSLGRVREPIGENTRTAISTRTFGMEPMPDDAPAVGAPLTSDPLPAEPPTTGG
ncbi:MAG: hypothetical protein H7Y15_09575 [Pseudonocardia sp.]|nr:hypothetical protein [Pseudonocardia sp.]